MIRFVPSLVCACVLSLASLEGEEPARAAAFAEESGKRVESKPSVRGDDDDWLFLVQELRHLSKNRFWESSWEEVAANQGDPVASMLEFHGLLEEKGVSLILVPIPAKARIYPEKLDLDFQSGDPASLQPFCERLRESGLTVLDCDTRFREARNAEDGPSLYCAQDAHYSPRAIELVADWIAAELGVEAGEGSSIRRSEETTLEIIGDQVVGSEWEGKIPQESLIMTPVLENETLGVNPDRESPYLLMGDSHTLVFQAGKEAGMHCRGAGLSDHLSERLGQAVDLVGVRGSGMVQARKQLYFRATSEPGFWERKKVVIWVFSEREWTQSTDRLLSIPLDR
ncbi:MAG: hypothetical protein AAGF67_09620 [Verrucomicrobiota bacterium]